MEDTELEVEEDSPGCLTVQRHRRNATEELRDHRWQGERERRMVSSPPAGDVRTSLPASSSRFLSVYYI